MAGSEEEEEAGNLTENKAAKLDYGGREWQQQRR
jgi:hypothetical protein